MDRTELQERIADHIEPKIGGSKHNRWTWRHLWRPLPDTSVSLNETRTKLVVRDLLHRDVTIAVPLVKAHRRSTTMWAMARREHAEELTGGDGTAAADAEMVDDLIRDAAEQLQAHRAEIRRGEQEAEAEDHAELDLIGVEEAAEIAGTTPDAIHQQLSRGGTIPTPIPVAGSRVRVWRRRTIQDWAAARPGRGRPAHT